LKKQGWRRNKKRIRWGYDKHTIWIKYRSDTEIISKLPIYDSRLEKSTNRSCENWPMM